VSRLSGAAAPPTPVDVRLYQDFSADLPMIPGE
jgi:hypothetical protein